MNEDVTGLVHNGQTWEPHPAHRRPNDTSLFTLPSATCPGLYQETTVNDRKQNKYVLCSYYV